MRLFVCVRPSPEALQHLRGALPPGHGGGERWHVTLAFLGEVADPAPVVAALAGVSGPPLRLSLAGSGRFGRGPVWVGVAGDTAGLSRLAADVQRACREAGAQVEHRPFRPHLTVGRRGRPDPAALASYAGPEWVADVVELVRSRLGRTVEHEVLHRFPLSGRVP